ncbi:MAG: hypothetical protein QMD08_02195 [Actinomycetota bacterium]|nr:hypothetical protein [Actinomycetota bacterium]
MRKALVLALIPIFLLAMSGAAFAAGYLDDSIIQAMTSPDDPHGGYANTTNRCKACHAVHLATGSYRLLRASTAATECDYCHKSGTGIITTVSRVDGTTTEGHTMGAYVNTTAPDEVDASAFKAGSGGLKCADCHSVHDNNTVILSGKSSSKLLKNNPDGYGSAFTTTSDESQWCADCHDANYGLHTQSKTVGGATVYGHDCDTAGMSTTADGFAVVSAADASNKGPTCKQCHQSSGYPHSQGGATSRDMLKDAFNGTALDDVCNDCHNTVSLP